MSTIEPHIVAVDVWQGPFYEKTIKRMMWQKYATMYVRYQRKVYEVLFINGSYAIDVQKER